MSQHFQHLTLVIVCLFCTALILSLLILSILFTIELINIFEFLKNMIKPSLIWLMYWTLLVNFSDYIGFHEIKCLCAFNKYTSGVAQSGEWIDHFEIFSRPRENKLAWRFFVKFNLLLFFLISKCWECFMHIRRNISIMTVS